MMAIPLYSIGTLSYYKHAFLDLVLNVYQYFLLAVQHWSSKRRHPTSKVRSGDLEEILHVQGKRNLSKTVGAERGHQRADRQKPQSQKANQSNHMGHSLV